MRGGLFLKLELKRYHLKMLWMQANKYEIICYLFLFLEREKIQRQERKGS